jgi:hypothetical protein
MKIIFIHGRDQQGKDSLDLKRTWTETLAAGLIKTGNSIPDDTQIVFPYFGDKLDELVKKADLPETVERIVQKGSAADSQLPFVAEFLSDLSENAGIGSDEILAEFTGDTIEKGALNWPWIQAVLRTLDKHTSFGDFSIKQWTYDVYMYLTKPGIAREIERFVLQEIGKEPCVVVAHSLGSIIAYNVLKANPQLKIKSFITVGSPLGLTSIKKRLEKPLPMPGCIEQVWFNAYDNQDVVALNSLTFENFDIDPEITNYSDVKNQTQNRHGIEGYLNDKKVAKFIYDQLP